MNEIATYSMILSKTGLGSSGSECPTKSSILAIDELIIIDNSGSYASRECVRIRDIRKREITSDFVLTVTPTSMAFSPSGGTKSFTVESYKNTTVEGSGTTKEELSWTASISGSGFSVDGNNITASANNGGERTGSLLITQAESGKTVSISLRQTSADISYNYYLNVEPTSMSFASTGGNQSFTVSSYKTQVVNGVEQSEQIPVSYSSAISGEGFSMSGNSVIAASNGGNARTGKVIVTQAESNKTGSITLSQQGKPSPWVYTFKINPWEFNAPNTVGTSASFTITSTKTKDGVTEQVGWQIDSSTVPSWVTFNQSNMTFTVVANAGEARSANIYFTQAESGNREFYRISQAKADTPWVYTFNVNPTSFSSSYAENTYSSNITSTKSRESETQNVAWSVDMSTVPNWITATKVSDTNINFKTSQNTTTTQRSATIKLTQAESNLSRTVTITQGAKPSPEYTFGLQDTSGGSRVYVESFTKNLIATGRQVGDASNKSEEQLVYIQSNKYDKTIQEEAINVGWNYECNANWISFNKGNNILYYTASVNTSYNPREATITFTQAETGKKCYIYVNQEGKVSNPFVVYAKGGIALKNNAPNDDYQWGFRINIYNERGGRIGPALGGSNNIFTNINYADFSNSGGTVYTELYDKIKFEITPVQANKNCTLNSGSASISLTSSTGASIGTKSSYRSGNSLYIESSDEITADMKNVQFNMELNGTWDITVTDR